MEWIKVIEGDNTTLPKVGEKVLVFTKWGHFEVSELYEDKCTKYEHVKDGLYKKIEVSNIFWSGNYPVYWMPLPEPPKPQQP